MSATLVKYDSDGYVLQSDKQLAKFYLVEQVDARIADLERENAELLAVIAEPKALSFDDAIIKSAITALVNMRNALEAENVKLKQQLASINKDFADRVTYKRQLREALAQVELLKQSEADAKRFATEIHRIAGEEYFNSRAMIQTRCREFLDSQLQGEAK